MTERNNHNKGIAPIKAQYLLARATTEDTDSTSAPNPLKRGAVDAGLAPPETAESEVRDADDGGDSRGGDRNNGKGGDKKRSRGQNKPKDRPRGHVRDAMTLCAAIARSEVCAHGDACKHNHDAAAYMAVREPDLGGMCPNFAVAGRCLMGLRCRYSASHTEPGSFQQIADQEKFEAALAENPGASDITGLRVGVLNHLGRELHYDLAKHRVKYPKTAQYFGDMQREARAADDAKAAAAAADANADVANTEVAPATEGTAIKSEPTAKAEPAIHPDIPTAPFVAALEFKILPREKKRLDFSGKSYLAPLTTVGNLPFRRMCKDLGVDVTVGEMAHAHSIAMGNFSEWALLKRHKAEDFFGVQIAGGKTQQVLEACELINEYCNVDFVDLNLGCPIDSVYGHGCGSALLDRPKRVYELLRGMDHVLDVPITAKVRTGVDKGKNIAHKFIPTFREIGVQLTTIHGRSRQQRYKALADWDYIQECSQLKGDMQVFGNGDILDHQEYYAHLENSSVDGVMIGRGALIKPWIFTEIKERRVWDISSRERFDLLRNFTTYGLEHWGTDTQGVNNTRRFLLELLSFTHRYIPVGLLEVLPQRINERPPAYVGRDDLETLMGSPYVGDWIKISEMLLGKAPERFSFLPKHKSNSYDDRADGSAVDMRSGGGAWD
ncbi:hypothetical protein BC828DRAFT_383010 [Blastocladiella britannica]|nr:hypothetical protein BC828DRAFT_383010 [Blastocladiella britannica]